MEIFEDILSKLATPVNAQSNATAQPTFGVITNTPTQNNLARVELNATSPSQNLGQPFSVDIVVNTGSIEIIEYQVVLEFQTNRLSVIDASPSEAGNQVEFLDDVFDVINDGNLVTVNTETGVGRITLIASSPDGVGTLVNRTVGRITFQPQALGATEIKHVDGIDGTVLFNAQQLALQSTRNNLVVAINAATTSLTSTTTTTTTATTTATQTNTATNSTVTSSPGGVDEIPATGIFDSSYMPLILGVLLVMLGISAASERKRQTPNIAKPRKN